MSYSLVAMEAAKQDLIRAIARSQTAMARILESLADVSTESRETATHLAQNIATLTEYQRTMAQAVCGVSLHRVYFGTPTSPWITKKCYQANDITRGEHRRIIDDNKKSSVQSSNKKQKKE